MSGSQAVMTSAAAGRAVAQPLPGARRRNWRRLSDLLLMLLLAAIAMLAVWYVLRDLPIRSVRIAGTLEHVDRATLEGVINRRLHGGFFGVDVEAVRRAVQGVSWVKEASVRRIWPDSLHVAVVERQAAARWGEHELLEADGSVFRPEGGARPALAELLGPPGAAARVFARYRALQRQLAPLQRRLERLALNERGTWRGQLDTGMVMIFEDSLGEAQLRQFVEVASKVLRARLDEITQVDLRYANGFAVRWKTKPQQVSE